MLLIAPNGIISGREINLLYVYVCRYLPYISVECLYDILILYLYKYNKIMYDINLQYPQCIVCIVINFVCQWQKSIHF